MAELPARTKPILEQLIGAVIPWELRLVPAPGLLHAAEDYAVLRETAVQVEAFPPDTSHFLAIEAAGEETITYLQVSAPSEEAREPGDPEVWLIIHAGFDRAPDSFALAVAIGIAAAALTDSTVEDEEHHLTAATTSTAAELVNRLAATEPAPSVEAGIARLLRRTSGLGSILDLPMYQGWHS